MGTLRVNQEAFRKAQGSKTLKTFADELALHQGTVSKMLAGKDQPGPKFITNSLLALPFTFDQLFIVEGPLREDES